MTRALDAANAMAQAFRTTAPGVDTRTFDDVGRPAGQIWIDGDRALAIALDAVVKALAGVRDGALPDDAMKAAMDRAAADVEEEGPPLVALLTLTPHPGVVEYKAHIVGNDETAGELFIWAEKHTERVRMDLLEAE